MKITASLFLITVCCEGVVLAHQPRERRGLIGAMNNETPDYLLHRPRLIFEKNSDGSRSQVVVVNGQDEFMQFVISASMIKPVIVLMHSMMSQDSQNMRPVYKDVAEEYRDKVVFISMDLFDQCNGVSENYELMAQFMHQENIGRLDLPIMLFFRNGMLYAPPHLPATVLQGFHTRDNLSATIKDKFFVSQDPISPGVAHDLTITSTGLSLPVRPMRQKPKASKAPSPRLQQSWWKRLFMRKKNK